MENKIPSGVHPTGKYERVNAVELGAPLRYKIPPGGLLHEVIVGFDPPLINTDAGNPIFVEIAVRGEYSKPEIPTYIHSRIETLATD